MDTFLDTLLSRLAHASVQALLLAAVVYAACRIVPALSASARSTLWWLLGAQLLVGLVCPALLGVPLLPAAAPSVFVTGPALADTGAMSATPETGWTFSWSYAVLTLWLVAVLAQCAVAVVRWHQLRGVVQRALYDLRRAGQALRSMQPWKLGFCRSLSVTGRFTSVPYDAPPALKNLPVGKTLSCVRPY